MINDIINIGGDVVIKIIDLAKMIISLTNSSSKIINLPPLIDGDMTRRQPDNTKMLAILGRDLLSIEEGIKLMLADENFVNSCVE